MGKYFPGSANWSFADYVETFGDLAAGIYLTPRSMETFQIVYEVQAENLEQAQAYALEIAQRSGIDPNYLYTPRKCMVQFDKSEAIENIKQNRSPE